MPGGRDLTQETLLSVVAVIDATEVAGVVWHVHTGPDIGLARLCGAWVLPREESRTLQQLIRGRYVLTTRAGELLRAEVSAFIAGHLDTDGIERRILTEVTFLQEKFEEELARRVGAKENADLVPPDWPVLPATRPWEPRPLNPSTDKTAHTALGAASWLADLAQTWQKVESQRLLRKKYLGEHGGSDPRPLPLIALSMTSS
ncbi:MAG: hypothetical protein ACRC20_04765 [Segniliparus sp.]|uniref:hypothetical protein n=1 Tax=Segniliparus sp. TaxID=2804064 RepID=UPI003F2F3DE1